jgi:hypothetical protein
MEAKKEKSGKRKAVRHGKDDGQAGDRRQP